VHSLSRLRSAEREQHRLQVTIENVESEITTMKTRVSQLDSMLKNLQANSDFVGLHFGSAFNKEPEAEPLASESTVLTVNGNLHPSVPIRE